MEHSVQHRVLVRHIAVHNVLFKETVNNNWKDNPHYLQEPATHVMNYSPHWIQHSNLGIVWLPLCRKKIIFVLSLLWMLLSNNVLLLCKLKSLVWTASEPHVERDLAQLSLRCPPGRHLTSHMLPVKKMLCLAAGPSGFLLFFLFVFFSHKGSQTIV